MFVCDHCKKGLGGKFLRIEYVSTTGSHYHMYREIDYSQVLFYLHEKCWNKLFIFRREGNHRKEDCVCGRYAFYSHGGEFISVVEVPSLEYREYHHLAHFLPYWIGEPIKRKIKHANM